jgi:hypothetical protein
MESLELVKSGHSMIMENMKINKIIFMEIYSQEEWLHLIDECHQNNQEDRKEFMCVYCNCKKNLKMRFNENSKKGCKKIMDNNNNQFSFKLYPPLKNEPRASCS